MYVLLSEKTRISRRDRPCIWCPEKILKGEKYVRESSTFYREFQDHSWHPECLAAAREAFGENEEFFPHEHKRGSLNERE